METLFIAIVGIMFLLAITDLIVGVSNDAVNFLNSALGAKAGTFKQVMIIASIGIMFGSVFSSGMMEVARKGVFNPQFFTVDMIMFLFAAVMLTDIILLDFYNSIALPTSTTISIVFELLGSAIAVSFFAVYSNGDSITQWGEYINGNRAIFIIAGIFLSVVVAFILGWLIQYITRVIVSFNYQKTMRSFGTIFGSASVALILVFIVLKGLKGIPFLSSESLEIIRSNVGYISLGGFLISFILFQIFIGKKGFSVYTFVTLLGTFALAMAFASNDLVNFVGVPIASYDAFIAWKGSGISAQDYYMTALAEPVQTNPLFLIGAGVVMTLTLWFSKKARRVVQTSINLGRQEEGAERFDANDIARGLVRGTMKMVKMVSVIIPTTVRNKIEKRFIDSTPSSEASAMQGQAFDMVRASVNLVVAAGIILVGTSLKLPLSTTFVTFMVLMGTSLADKAWSQGSAVYRVSGVLTVVGGWFLTAIIALTVSVVFASLLVLFEGWALAGLVILAMIMILKKFLFGKKTKREGKVSLDMENHWFTSDYLLIEPQVREKLSLILDRFKLAYQKTLDGLIAQDAYALKEFKSQMKVVEKDIALKKVQLSQQLKLLAKENQKGGKVLMLIYEIESDLINNLRTIILASHRHVVNLHPDLQPEQMSLLKQVKNGVSLIVEDMLLYLKKDQISKVDFKSFKSARKNTIKLIDEGFSEQINLASTRKLSGKNSELLMTLLLSNKNIIVHCTTLVKLFYQIKSEKSKDILEIMLEEDI